MVEKILYELRDNNLNAFLRVDKDSPMRSAMNQLGYEGRFTTSKHYKEAGLSGDVYEFNFP